MVTVRGNALIGPDLKFVEDILIQIDEKGIIQKVSNEQKTAEYVLPPSNVIIPGFINAHTHVADACLKDFTYGLTLEEAVGPKGVKHSTLNSKSEEEKAQSIRNSLDMHVKNGFTAFVDFREEGIDGIKLLKEELNEYPIRAVILGRQYGDNNLADISEMSDGFGFSDVFSIDEDIMRQTKDLKENNQEKIAAIHASESMEVISESLTRFGKPDIEKICEYPFFDFVVHATYSNENDLILLKKNNTNVICCPISNLYHGLKFPPIALILKNELLLGLGTDNTFCNNPDPFRLMAFTLYSARSNYQTILPKEILKAVTVNPGEIIRRQIGQISEGFYGDLLGIDLNSPNTKYSKDVYSAITMRAEPSDIVFQMFKGKIVKWKDQK
ncbi:MAG: amidohydrolase family protein [Candidatus Heimdallarchaeota archaeon]|nr:amidohydrolase family protein [Candidatus Heimdallarchaeota archaeon]